MVLEERGREEPEYNQVEVKLGLICKRGQATSDLVRKDASCSRAAVLFRCREDCCDGGKEDGSPRIEEDPDALLCCCTSRQSMGIKKQIKKKKKIRSQSAMVFKAPLEPGGLKDRKR